MGRNERRRRQALGAAEGKVPPKPHISQSSSDGVIVSSWRGIPKTPQGWWTLGLTVMAALLAVLLWLRYH
jgi:hypothetical protein